MIAADMPDLMLLDIMMPGLSGYEVCRRLRADPATALLPIVLCTSLDPRTGTRQGHRGRCRRFPDQADQPGRAVRARQVAAAHQDPAGRGQGADREARRSGTAAGGSACRSRSGQIDRLGRLKRFFSPQLAEAITDGGGEDMLKTHRREISVVFIDLRGFTAFTDQAEPEEVMETAARLPRRHGPHRARARRHAGALCRRRDHGVLQRPGADGTTGRERGAHGAGDARRVSADRRGSGKSAATTWAWAAASRKGYATLGAIGFEGRWDYAAIGNVTNLAARLCSEAAAGQVLVDRKIMAKLEGLVEAEPVGPLNLKGIGQPVPAFLVVSIKPAA